MGISIVRHEDGGGDGKSLFGVCLRIRGFYLHIKPGRPFHGEKLELKVRDVWVDDYKGHRILRLESWS